MPEAEVAELFRQGVINEETLIWREGLDAWASLASTPNFAELLEGSLEGSDASVYDHDHDDDDATLIANPADEDLQAALAELLGEPGPTQQSPPPGVGDISMAERLPVTSSMQAHSPVDSIATANEVEPDASESSLSDDDDVESADELVDVHSVLSIATHTLDDLGEDLVQAPAPASPLASAPTNGPQTDGDEQEEKPTIAFAVPSGLLVSENINPQTAPLQVDNVVLDGASNQTEEDAARDDADPEGGDESIDASIRVLGSVDIDSSTHDPAYLEKAESEPDISIRAPDEADSAPSAATKKSLTFPPSAGDVSPLDKNLAPAAEAPLARGHAAPNSADERPEPPAPIETAAELPEPELQSSAGLSALRDAHTAVQTSQEPVNPASQNRDRPSSSKRPFIGLIIVLLLFVGGVLIFLTQGPEPSSTPAIAPKRLVIKTVQKDAAPSTEVLADAAPGQQGRPPLDAGTRSPEPDAASPAPAKRPVPADRPAAEQPERRVISKAKAKRSGTPPAVSPGKTSPSAKSANASRTTGKKIEKAAKTKPADGPETNSPTRKVTTQAKTVEVPAKTVEVPAKNTSGLFKGSARTKRPLTLSRQKIMKVLRKNQARLKDCLASDPSLKGRLVSVAIQIKRNGRVGRARIASSRARGTAAGTCIEGQVKTYRFPPFRGDPMSITLPIQLK